MSPLGAENVDSVASVFAALGDRTRLSLLTRLHDGRSMSITELTQDTGVTRQGVSKHLNVLEASGIVSCARVGRETRYAIRAEGLSEAKQYLARASRQWDEAVERLQKHIRE